MEVINCLDTGYRAHSLARMAKPRARPVFAARRKYSSTTGQAHTLRNILVSAKSGGLYFSRCVKVAAKFIWLLPVVTVAAVIPCVASKLVGRTENFAKVVPIAGISENQHDEILDSAMSEFAFGSASYYDSDGNVFSDEGEPLRSATSFKEPVTFKTYTVKSGDTISGISQMFGLSNISTLVAVNDISNVRSLSVGRTLTIPSTDGLLHIARAGETVASLSIKYGVSLSDIVDVNELSSESLNEGDRIFIPGAKMDSTALKRAMGELFVNPLHTQYRITSRFGPRSDPFTGVASSHTGVDMACPTGTPIYASMSGTVVKTGFTSVYGNYVIINHIDGYQTLYAHMSKILTKKGTVVTQDSQIGLVGSTGYSTGPHLHFTVYKNHRLVDPFTLVKGM